MGFILSGQSHYDNPKHIIGRICSNVGKIGIQCYYYTFFFPAQVRKVYVGSSDEILLGNSNGIISCLIE